MSNSHTARTAYIDLIKRSITNYLYLGDDQAFDAFQCVRHYDLNTSNWTVDRRSQPLTLLTKGQLDLIEQAVFTVTQRKVPGDFLEAGIWRGGVVVFLRALLTAYELGDRTVVGADSFAGIPMNERARNDPVDGWTDRWVASLDGVRAAIARFGLLDDRIELLPGFFSDTLGSLRGRTFALVRLDSDSYDSVETSLEYLYPLIPRGGIVIIDDWHLAGCQMAVQDYRTQCGITDPLEVRDGNAFWVKRQDYNEPAFPDPSS